MFQIPPTESNSYKPIFIQITNTHSGGQALFSRLVSSCVASTTPQVMAVISLTENPLPWLGSASPAPSPHLVPLSPSGRLEAW